MWVLLVIFLVFAASMVLLWESNFRRSQKQRMRTSASITPPVPQPTPALQDKAAREAKGQASSGPHATPRLDALKTGAMFIKYGRKGSPHPRKIVYDSATSSFLWGAKAKQKIMLQDISEVLEGCQTKIFEKRYYFSYKPVHLCFSLKTTTRTLDLQAPDAETRAAWISAIRDLKEGKELDPKPVEQPKESTRTFVPFKTEIPGKEYKFENIVQGVDLETFKQHYHGRVKLGNKIGDTTIVDIKTLVDDPGYKERIVSYRLEPTFFTKVCGDTGQMECRVFDEPDRLSISLINRTGARWASITETLVVTAEGPTSVHLSQASMCAVLVNRLMANAVQNFWHQRYKKYHETGEFLKEYKFASYQYDFFAYPGRVST